MSGRRKTRAATRARSAARAAPIERDWPRLLGEGTILALALVLPSVIHPRSRNMMDLKDLALGVGVAAGLALVLISSLARGRLAWASARLNVAVGAYLAVAAGSLVYSRYRFATASELAKLAALVGLYWLVILSVRQIGQVRRIIWAAAVGAVPVCIYAFMQASGHDPLRWNTSTTRVFSLLGNATYLAGYLVLVMPLVVAVAWPRPPAHRQGVRPSRIARELIGRSFLAALTVMMVIALYLTVSLSPTIGLGLGVALAVLLVLIRGGRPVLRLVIPATAAGLIAFLLVGYLGYRRLPRTQQQRWQQVARLKDPYGEQRGTIQRVGLEIFRERPLAGRAYGTYAIYALERLAPSWYTELGKSTSTMLVPNYAHNEFIEVLAETGVVGALVFAVLVVWAFLTSVRVAVRHPDAEWARLGLAITVGMTAFMFQNMFGVTFRQTGTVAYFWLSLGLLSVARAQAAAPADAVPGTALREMRFRRLSLPALGGISIVAAAVVWLIASLGVRPVKSNVLLKRAEQEAKQGYFEAAARHADEALRLNPYSSHGYYISAYAWGSLGDYERALKANQRALELLPGNATVYFNLGVSYKDLGRLDEARQSFQRAIELMPTAARHHAAMAETLVAMSRYDDALPYAVEAVRLEPANSTAHLLVGEIQAHRGDHSAAAAEMEQALRLAPDKLVVLPKLGLIHLRTGKLEQAAQVARQWMALDPSSADARSLLAEVQRRRGDLTGAAQQMEEAARLAPGNLAVLRGLAQVYFSLRDSDKAMSAARRWLALSPNEPEAYLILGVAQSRQRNFPEAKQALQRAIELQPDNLGARLQLAYCYLQLKDQPRARRELQWLAANHPQSPEGRQAARWLAQGAG